MAKRKGREKWQRFELSLLAAHREHLEKRAAQLDCSLNEAVRRLIEADMGEQAAIEPRLNGG